MDHTTPINTKAKMLNKALVLPALDLVLPSYNPELIPNQVGVKFIYVGIKQVIREKLINWIMGTCLSKIMIHLIH